MYWKNKDFTRFMSGLSSLNKRLAYRGGTTDNRLNEDKLRSLKNALHNSYQSATAILSDNREFKCLINPDKLHTAYDNKIISIPYEDRCLNSDSLENVKVGLKTGDVFTWKENNSHWIIYLQYLEERAYFRADIRKCDQEININNKKYWVYIRGPVETSVQWNQKAGIEWNDLNYSLVMFVTRDENTQDFFHRFTKIKIREPGSGIEKTWKVVAYDPYYGDGIIQICLDEDFENSIQDAVDKENEEAQKPILPIDKNAPMITGSNTVKKYDTVTYIAENFLQEGSWYLIKDGKKTKLDEKSKELTLDITKSKGTFIVQYETESQKADIQVSIVAF